MEPGGPAFLAGVFVGFLLAFIVGMLVAWGASLGREIEREEQDGTKQIRSNHDDRQKPA